MQSRSTGSEVEKTAVWRIGHAATNGVNPLLEWGLASMPCPAWTSNSSLCSLYTSLVQALALSSKCVGRACFFGVFQAAQERAQLHQASLELTHQLAVNTATRLITTWQQLTAVQRHHRQRVLRGCWGVWTYWAARHKVKSRVLRAAVQQLNVKKLERCFYSWRWYCQV